jgi:hydrogenase-4 component E
MTPDLAMGLLETAAAGMVGLGIWLAVARSLEVGVLVLAAQSLLLGVAAIGVGAGRGSVELIAGGFATIAVRAVVLPLVVRRLVHATPVRHERRPYLSRRTSAFAAIVIVFVAGAAVGGVHGLPGGTSARALPAAVAEVLTGLLLIATRRKSISMVIGLLVFENGITLAALAMTAGMPLIVELGATFDLLIVLVVVQVHGRRMLETIGDLSTDSLRNLRG